MNYLLGVDIGGTTVKIGIISENGEIISKWEIPTKKGDQIDQIPNDIWSAIKDRADQLQIRHDQLLGIGVGAPGFVEAETGNVAEAVNIGWKNFPLGHLLSQLSSLPVYVDNDANIAALGESWLGSGDLADNLIAITLGTGVGGGIIANGKIVSGTNGTAGEIGHMVVTSNGAPCNCGRTGCLETVASATGIARIAEEKVKSDLSSTLSDVLQKQGKLTAKDVFEAAKLNDNGAIQIVQEVTDILGMAIANIATIVNPSKIIIGGGVSKAGDVLLKPLITAYQKYALPRTFEGSEFVIAELGNDAGIIGGGYLVKQNQTVA